MSYSESTDQGHLYDARREARVQTMLNRNRTLFFSAILLLSTLSGCDSNGIPQRPPQQAVDAGTSVPERALDSSPVVGTEAARMTSPDGLIIAVSITRKDRLADMTVTGPESSLTIPAALPLAFCTGYLAYVAEERPYVSGIAALNLSQPWLLKRVTNAGIEQHSPFQSNPAYVPLPDDETTITCSGNILSYHQRESGEQITLNLATGAVTREQF